ncbi:hypothetical protein RVD_104 [viral metagenome]
MSHFKFSDSLLGSNEQAQINQLINAVLSAPEQFTSCGQAKLWAIQNRDKFAQIRIGNYQCILLIDTERTAIALRPVIDVSWALVRWELLNKKIILVGAISRNQELANRYGTAGLKDLLKVMCTVCNTLHLSDAILTFTIEDEGGVDSQFFSRQRLYSKLLSRYGAYLEPMSYVVPDSIKESFPEYYEITDEVYTASKF